MVLEGQSETIMNLAVYQPRDIMGQEVKVKVCYGEINALTTVCVCLNNNMHP